MSSTSDSIAHIAGLSGLDGVEGNGGGGEAGGGGQGGGVVVDDEEEQEQGEKTFTSPQFLDNWATGDSWKETSAGIHGFGVGRRKCILVVTAATFFLGLSTMF